MWWGLSPRSQPLSASPNGSEVDDEQPWQRGLTKRRPSACITNRKRLVTLANTRFISLKLNGSPWWETNEWRSWNYSHCANQEFYDKSIAITAATYLPSIALLCSPHSPKTSLVWPKVQNPKIKTQMENTHITETAWTRWIPAFIQMIVITVIIVVTVIFLHSMMCHC